MSSVREVADRAHARYAASHRDLLTSIADLTDTEAWRGDGARTLAAWLAARWQVDEKTAHRWVGEATALRARAALDAALGAGEISCDQAGVLARLSTPEDEAAWVESLPFWSLSELQREARKKTARELERRDGGTYLRMSHTTDERYMRGEFQLAPEDGAAVLTAIERRIPAGTLLRDWDHACGTALVELTKSALGTGHVPDKATVVLHVHGNDSPAALASGGFVSAQTARRLACDAKLQVVTHHDQGQILGIGRTSRTVPEPMRRAREDDGSRFDTSRTRARPARAGPWQEARVPPRRLRFRRRDSAPSLREPAPAGPRRGGGSVHSRVLRSEPLPDLLMLGIRRSSCGGGSR